MMKERKLEIYLFFILLFLALFLVFQIFSPYIYTLIVALIFTVLFNPFHKKIEKKIPKHKSLATFLTLGFVICIVIIPLTFFGIELSNDVKKIYEDALSSSSSENIVERVTMTANELVETFSPFPIERPVFEVSDTESYAISVLVWIRSHFGDIFSEIAKFFINFLLFIIAFYYFLKDGDKFKDSLIKISPFRDDRDEAILDKLRLAIVTTVKGSILVALIQGAISGLGFLIFGIPSPVFWGSIAAVAALIPGVGTAIVLIPAFLFLLFTSTTASAIGLLIWGIIAVGLVDNIIGPKFMEKGVNIHPLFILLSAIGGIVYFGVVGFILGPIILSFLFSLLDIYKTIIVKDNIQ